MCLNFLSTESLQRNQLLEVRLHKQHPYGISCAKIAVAIHVQLPVAIKQGYVAIVDYFKNILGISVKRHCNIVYYFGLFNVKFI